MELGLIYSSDSSLTLFIDSLNNKVSKVLLNRLLTRVGSYLQIYCWQGLYFSSSIYSALTIDEETFYVAESRWSTVAYPYKSILSLGVIDSLFSRYFFYSS
jgi:hypothetical protein